MLSVPFRPAKRGTAVSPIVESPSESALARWARGLELVGKRGLPFSLAAVLAYVIVEEARTGVAGAVIAVIALVNGLSLVSWFVLATIVDARNRRELRSLEAQLTEKVATEAPAGEVLELGVRLAEHGRAEAAEEAFGYVEDSRDSEHAPVASLRIGMLRGGLAAFGPPQPGYDGAPDVPLATESLRRAIDSGHPEAAPEAMLVLGVLRAQNGDTDGAAEAWSAASESGHGDHAPNADYNLGRLHQNLGGVDEATAAYRRAVESGHSWHAPMAAVNLGALLLEDGDLPGARSAFQYAVDNGNPDQARRGRIGLAQVRAQES